MSKEKTIGFEYSQTEPVTEKQLQPNQPVALQGVWWKKIRGVVLLAIGYLLSPLCWWNDLFLNLPLAYGFGYICSLFRQDLLFPAAIVGYWLSNIVGILLMQVGAVKVLKQQPQERQLKKDLLSGLAFSSIYTLIILLLVQFHILDMPEFGTGTFNFGSLFMGTTP